MPHDANTTDTLLRSVERNRYFYGKLMTVRDFLQEQQYFNSKRQILNRLLFGSGVVCGLDVVEGQAGMSDTQIDILPGIALDPLGREITVLRRDRFDLRDLKDLKPVGNKSERRILICLSYNECQREPRPSMKSSPCDETCESNRIMESYTVEWDDADPDPANSLCEEWMNRKTVTSAAGGGLQIERSAPLWVRQGETFEVAVKVTARQAVAGAQLTEVVTNGTPVEPTTTQPNPQTATVPGPQFPTPPVSLQEGEFFLYVYQVQAPRRAGTVTIRTGAGLPALESGVEVVTSAEAERREVAQRLQDCEAPAHVCVPVATATVNFRGNQVSDIKNLETGGAQRFRYNLERVSELLECIRESIQAESGAPRPGHALITFKDLENRDPRPVSPAPSRGVSFTVARGDHTHALLLENQSGLIFSAETRLRVDGPVGGRNIDFQYPVLGQTPTADRHLVTKQYVDSRIAGLDWQESVRDKDLTAPPPGPTAGDRYLILSTVPVVRPPLPQPPPIEPLPSPRLPRPGDLPEAIAAGEPADDASRPRPPIDDEPGPTPPPPSGPNPWAGNENRITTWNGRVWEFGPVPDEGTAVFVEDENTAYLFVDGRWIPFLAQPSVTAGKGLFATNAVLNVGQGAGLQVNDNDVSVIFSTSTYPVGDRRSAGAGNTLARGDHEHDLPLAPNSGLEFVTPLMVEPPTPTTPPYVPPVGRTPAETEGAPPSPDTAATAANATHFDERAPTRDEGDLTKLGGAATTPGGAATRDFPIGFDVGRFAEIIRVEEEKPAADEAARKAAEDASARLTQPPDAARFEATDIRPLSPLTAEPPDTGVKPGGTNTLPTLGDLRPPVDVTRPPIPNFPRPTIPPLTPPTFPPLPTQPPVPTKPPIIAQPPVGTLPPRPILPPDEPPIRLPPEPPVEPPLPRTSRFKQLRVNGPVGGEHIDFLNPVLGQDPVHERHLVTKRYVDSKIAGLDWQESVKDKDLTRPPFAPQPGDRYLVVSDVGIIRPPIPEEVPPTPEEVPPRPPVDETVPPVVLQPPPPPKPDPFETPPIIPPIEVAFRSVTRSEEPPPIVPPPVRLPLDDIPPTPIPQLNPWRGHVNQIATWNGRAWEFGPVADEGTAVFVEDENAAYLFVDGRWVPFLGSGPQLKPGVGLRLDGDTLSVVPAEGVQASSAGVGVRFGADVPPPVSFIGNPGSQTLAARADHTHEIPLSSGSGLVFREGPIIAGDEGVSIVGGEAVRIARPVVRPTLQINGPVAGESIDFLRPVSGQDPVQPQHLATRRYVDQRISGLDWQESVRSKDVRTPPPENNPGDRYLILSPDEIYDNSCPPNIINQWWEHDGSIATWNGAAWDYTPPTEGMTVFVEDEGNAYIYMRERWTPFLNLATPPPAPPPATVNPGLGLSAVRDSSGATTLSVRPGVGVDVSNGVSVLYGQAAGAAVGPAGSAGQANTAARSDHTHPLLLAAQSGLAFNPDRSLRLGGSVAASDLNFLNPVFGRDPIDPSHLATKGYVDARAQGGGGGGAVMQMATGLLVFDLRDASTPTKTDSASYAGSTQPQEVVSDPINPRLGPGPLCVVLGLEEKEIGVLIMSEPEKFFGLGYAPVRLAPEVLMNQTDPEGNTLFRIFAHAGDRAQVLPVNFAVRWWAWPYPREFDMGVQFYRGQGGVNPDPTF